MKPTKCFRLGCLTPANETYAIGFRVSEVPEPATIAVLALGGMMGLRRKK